MMLPPTPTFACRYDLSGWPAAPAKTLYFIVEDMNVVWTDGVPEIVDCSTIDIVAVI